MNKTQIYEFARLARKDGKTWLEVLTALKKAKALTRYCTVEDLKSIYQEIAGQIAVYGVTKTDAFDSNVKQFFEFIGKTRENIKAKESLSGPTDEDVTIVISDVHVPYHDMEKITRMLDAERGKANRLLIAGDFLNGTQLSTHPKMIVEDFQKEVSQGRMLLEILAADFPEVIIMDDNHVDSRWQRLLANQLSPDLHFLTTHPYDYLVAGLKNVKRSAQCNEMHYAEEFGWIYKIGDAIFSHAEISSSQEFKSVRRVEDFFRKWGPALDLGPVRFVAQAHNHNLGIYHDIDSAVAYTGCMVSLDGLKYSMGARSIGGPPIHGYLKIVQKNGKTDLEKTETKRLMLN